MFADYYFPGGPPPWAMEQHFLHCLHALQQSLQCKYSTDVYLAAWLEGSDVPVNDFNITRKCLDYDHDLNAWKDKTQRTDAEFFGLRAPSDAILRPQSIF
jgi:hypothetical protein